MCFMRFKCNLQQDQQDLTKQPVNYSATGLETVMEKH